MKTRKYIRLEIEFNTPILDFILVQLVGSDFVQWCKRDEITKLANNKIKANTFVNNKLSAKEVK